MKYLLLLAALMLQTSHAINSPAPPDIQYHYKKCWNNVGWHMLTVDGLKVSVKENGCSWRPKDAIAAYKVKGSDYDGWKCPQSASSILDCN